MAIRMVVTTCPPAALFTMPYSPMGAIGWMITMPMMIKFHSVSERFRRGPEFSVLSLLKPFSFSPRHYDATGRWPPAAGERILPAAVYSIVSMLTVCAILPPHATAKGCSPPALTRSPRFGVHLLSCTLVQVAESPGRYLLPHALLQSRAAELPPASLRKYATGPVMKINSQ